MTDFNAGLKAHLATGQTTTCRCWSVTRTDDQVLGFTDHDIDLSFEGITFKAETGLSARALQQTTGLAVDNTEAMGAISDASISEADIEAGRYDGAEVRAWLVNWSNLGERQLQFRGTIGEIKRSGGAFEAELRGMTDRLNFPYGRVYQRNSAVLLGDDGSGFDLSAANFSPEVPAVAVEDRRIFRFDTLLGYADGWFLQGSLIVLDGAAANLGGLIKRDYEENDLRVIELWQPLRSEIVTPVTVRLIAGFNGRADEARIKFDNLRNFQGFPDIPGDDWVITDPSRSGRLDGGSRRR
ncbi:MAG: DUF2163 domain-containing protein [Pseudomonadota bacterium]